MPSLNWCGSGLLCVSVRPHEHPRRPLALRQPGGHRVDAVGAGLRDVDVNEPEEHGVHIFPPQTWRDEIRRHVPALKAAGLFCLFAYAGIITLAWLAK
jgi:hypothetical protein